MVDSGRTRVMPRNKYPKEGKLKTKRNKGSPMRNKAVNMNSLFFGAFDYNPVVKLNSQKPSV
jgi:hypothetical protein